MKALKKQLAFLLSVISVLCILPITASAKEESEQKQYIKLNAPIILEKGNEVEFKFGINDGYYEFSPVFRPISSTAQSVKYSVMTDGKIPFDGADNLTAQVWFVDDGKPEKNLIAMSYTRIKNWLQFLTDGIWRITEDEISPVRRQIYSCIKIVYLSVNQFLNDRIQIRTSALTYSTLLSIIPILAILFAIARGFGFDALMEIQLRKGVASQQSELIISWINSYLEHAQSGIFIGIGLIMLLWTVLILTDNIERSFNAIWQVKHPRSVFRKITDYFSMILLLPLLIVISSGLTIFMTTYIKNMDNFLVLAPILKFLVRLTPYALTWGMFIGLYIFIPNTKVKLKHAWFPGILAGTAFQAFQFFYVNSQIWVSNYNAIYGSFAAIPMFLLWTQISWTICLFGAEMSYVSQNLGSFDFGKESANISRRYHDFFCTIILSAICKSFAEEKTPYSAEEISKQYKIPIRLTKRILYELQDIHLIFETIEEKKGDVRYLPGIDINKLTVGTLLEKLDSAGSEDFKVDRQQYSDSWKILEHARKEYMYNNSQILLKDL